MRVLVLEPFSVIKGHYLGYVKGLVNSLSDEGHNVCSVTDVRIEGLRSDVVQYYLSHDRPESLSWSEADIKLIQWRALRVHLIALKLYLFSRFDMVYQVDWSVLGLGITSILMHHSRIVIHGYPDSLLKRSVLKYASYWTDVGLVSHSKLLSKQLNAVCSKNYYVDLPPLVGANTTSSTYGSQKGPRKFTVLFFGVYAPWKGLELFLDVLDISRDTFEASVVISQGSGIPSQTLERLQRLNARYHNVVTEFVSEAAMVRFFQKADLIILPYDPSISGASGILSTAMALGKAVLASNSRYFSEVVEENHNLHVFDPYTPQAAFHAIEQLQQSLPLTQSNDSPEKEVRPWIHVIETMKSGAQNRWGLVGRR